MKWNPKEAIAEISGIVIATLLSGSLGDPVVASLAGGAAKGLVKGINKSTKEQTPKQILHEIIKTATKKALDEAAHETSFELPDDCKKAIIVELFSPNNAIKYLESDERTEILYDTICSIIGRYDECDIKTLPIQKIIEGIVHYIQAGMSDDLKALVLETNIITKLNHQDLQDIKKLLTKLHKKQASEKDTSDSTQMFHDVTLTPAFDINPAKLRKRCREIFSIWMKHRYYYHSDKVDQTILPPLNRDCELINGETVTLSGYLNRMRQTAIHTTQLLGEGGMGKTSSLLALWNELNNEMSEIPFMVQLHQVNLCKVEMVDTFLLQYLCETYFFPNQGAASQSQTAYLKGIFSRKTKNPEYVLLLDGFNEVTDIYKFKIARQIMEFLAFDNVRLIIASRQDMGEYLGMSDINTVTLQPLQSDNINAYIRSCGQNPDGSESVRELLRTPMLLTVYCETTKIVSAIKKSDFFRYLQFDTNVNKKGELISNYIESLAAKRFLDASKNEEEPYFALVQELWMDYFVLPEIAWSMVQHQFFQWEKTNPLIKALSKINILSTETRNWFRDRRLLNVWMDAQERLFPSNRQDSMPENILSYLESWPTIFVKRQYWEFIHQDYRDFCAARFVVNQWENSDDWDQQIPDDVLVFAGDIYDAYA